jgi:APA family basic amino acid/polyamine antiporter
MAHGWSGVLKAMGLTFIAFQGFEVISQCSEEVRNPKKNIPKAIFLSLLIVIPLYVLVAGVAMGSVQPEGGLSPWDFLALRKEIALVDVAKLFFPGGGIMLLIGGIISTMSALNATVYSSSRVAFAMGRDRNFPALFGKVHPKRFTPFVAIFFSFVIVIGMSLSLPIEDVASAADIMFLLLFLQVNVTLIRLRKKRPELDRGFLVPLFPYLTIIGIVMLLFLAVYMFNYSPLGWFVTAGWIAAGLLVYRGYASKREIEYVHRRKALERLEKKNFTILVPISNPRTAPSLVRIALAVAHRHDAEILLLHIVEVEEGMPLRSGYARTDQVLSVLEKAERLAYEGRIPVRSIVNVSHRISEGILETALEEDANFIVLGRAKRPGVVDRLFASVIDSVLDQAPCEVAVLHGELPASGIKTILIPFGLNIHTRLAFELAPNLAEYFKSKVQVVSVVEPHTSRQESADQIEQLMKQAEENKLTPHIHVIRNTAVTDGVVRRSGHADLIVMGGRSGGFLGLLFGQSLTQEITDRAACPVLWVNEYEEVPSLWQQLIAPFKKEVSKANG